MSFFLISLVKNDAVVDPALWFPLWFQSYDSTVVGRHVITTADLQTVPGITEITPFIQ